LRDREGISGEESTRFSRVPTSEEGDAAEGSKIERGSGEKKTLSNGRWKSQKQPGGKRNGEKGKCKYCENKEEGADYRGRFADRGRKPG